ncbi:MAG: hypothetical protein JWR54_397 [Mucilaginibacter sp.]|nr:hypothetical protein [Mucilaginibacter sp.]
MNHLYLSNYNIIVGAENSGIGFVVQANIYGKRGAFTNTQLRQGLVGMIIWRRLFSSIVFNIYQKAAA